MPERWNLRRRTTSNGAATDHTPTSLSDLPLFASPAPKPPATTPQTAPATTRRAEASTLTAVSTSQAVIDPMTGTDTTTTRLAHATRSTPRAGAARIPRATPPASAPTRTTHYDEHHDEHHDDEVVDVDLTLGSAPPPIAAPAPPAKHLTPANDTYDGVYIDWNLVTAYRNKAASILSDRFKDRPGIKREDEVELGRSVVRELIIDQTAADAATGSQLHSADAERALARAIMDSLFGIGRLQAHVDDETVEDIEAFGHDHVVVLRSNGTIDRVAPIADSDEQLIEDLAFMATQQPGGERPFSPFHPELQLTLGDRARLQAVAWDSPRPIVRIRIHRHIHTTLADLELMGEIDTTLRDFLTAAVAAKTSIVVAGAMGSGKALALNTPIPTPQGWTAMEHLRRGDQVFDERGNPCTVTHAHPVQIGRPCFEVTFDDESTIVADADHLWQVTTQADRARAARPKAGPTYVTAATERARLHDLAEQAAQQPDTDVTVAQALAEVGHEHRESINKITRHLHPNGHVRVHWFITSPAGRPARVGRDVRTYSRQLLLKELAALRGTPRGQRAPRAAFSILTTQQMAQQVLYSHDNPRIGWNHHVQLTKPLQYGTKDQLIDPYVLGVWLGDGATAAGRITTADPEIITELERLGFPMKRVGATPYDFAVGNDLHTKLRALGVLGDKHIPRHYLQGDQAQRLALLQGLMDSDGTVSMRRPHGTRDGRKGSLEFCSTSQVLAQQVRQLVNGLGYKGHLRSKPVTYAGRPCGTAYTIAWATTDPMFRLSRKLERQLHYGTGHSSRSITAIRAVPSVPVRCITVDSASALYLAGDSCIPTHNTTLVRALARAIPPEESYTTLESVPELFLHLSDNRIRPHAPHHERLGSGEVAADGRAAGERTMAQQFPGALRLNADRVIVGEVRGSEINSMFSAMRSGSGSISTIHAKSGRDTADRLATLLDMESTSGMSLRSAYAQVAQHIDLIVYLSSRRDPVTGRRYRFVSEVVEVLPGDHADTGISTEQIFAPGPDKRAVPNHPPSFIDELVEQGFDRALIDRREANWRVGMEDLR